MSLPHPHCPMCGGSWNVQNARCGAERHWQHATRFAVWLRWQVFWNAVGDAVTVAELEADACEHCGALPNEQDPYWASGMDFHANHCPHCGAYHAPQPSPYDFDCAGAPRRGEDDDISF